MLIKRMENCDDNLQKIKSYLSKLMPQNKVKSVDTIRAVCVHRQALSALHVLPHKRATSRKLSSKFDKKFLRDVLCVLIKAAQGFEQQRIWVSPLSFKTSRRRGWTSQDRRIKMQGLVSENRLGALFVLIIFSPHSYVICLLSALSCSQVLEDHFSYLEQQQPVWTSVWV